MTSEIGHGRSCGVEEEENALYIGAGALEGTPGYRDESISWKKEPLYIVEFSDHVTRVTPYRSCVWVRDRSIFGKERPV